MLEKDESLMVMVNAEFTIFAKKMDKLLEKNGETGALIVYAAQNYVKQIKAIDNLNISTMLFLYFAEVIKNNLGDFILGYEDFSKEFKNALEDNTADAEAIFKDRR